MKIVLLGGTKGMGRALGRELVGRGHTVFLLGRAGEDLDKSARDLELRAGFAPGSVGTAPCDLLDPDTFEPALARAAEVLAGFDTVVITAGLFATQPALEEDPASLQKMLTANFTGTILLCEAARKRLLAAGGGTLCVFSSVAGDRGRRPVILYGATKAGLSHYLEGLDHKFRSAGLRTICVKPGFVKTGMTAGLPTPPFAGEPGQVARLVAKAIEAGTPLVYTPAIWRLIMLVIRNLPRFVMRKISF
jgi:NAD(P)-dependent dehydrogenase (short-subunit alcohol dehydrogenase family)